MSTQYLIRDADTCRPMSPTLAWDECMSNLYSGYKRRQDFAHEQILPLLDEIEEIIEDKGIKRNLKTEFFERLLEKHGFLIIECMAHLRIELYKKSEGRKILSMIMDEWKEQSQVAHSHDTLRTVLISTGRDPIYICNALIIQARRLRGLSGARPENAGAAMKLVVEAKEIWKRNYDNENEAGEYPKENFCLVPNEGYERVIDAQKIFCQARFSDMDEVRKLADDMLVDLNSIVANWEGSHRPDKVLKWWMYQVKLRASAVCMDLVLWKKARRGMEKMEEEVGESVRSYLLDLKGRSQGISDSTAGKNVPNADLMKMRFLLSDWRDFREREYDVLKFRRRGGAQQHGDRELKSLQENFTASLKDFNRYILMGSGPGFVSHAYTWNEKNSKARARKILVEISECRRYVRLSDTNHSCFQLEILHRLLIYRIWWESYGKGFDLFSSGEDAHGDVGLSLKIPEKILEDIELDLENMHIHKTAGARWKKEIQKSIKVFREGGENLTDELRKRIDGFDNSFKGTEWPSGQGDIMGLPYNKEKLSPYEVMDPTMRHVGVNTKHAEREERTGYQYLG